jgi:hypothetical protein
MLTSINSSSISAIYNSGFGIKLYYIESRRPDESTGTNGGVRELTWTKSTGWSSPIRVFQAWAHESTSALTAATVDTSRLNQQSKSLLVINEIQDQIYLFYTDIDGSVISKVWTVRQMNDSYHSGGWGMGMYHSSILITVFIFDRPQPVICFQIPPISTIPACISPETSAQWQPSYQLPTHPYRNYSLLPEKKSSKSSSGRMLPSTTFRWTIYPMCPHDRTSLQQSAPLLRMVLGMRILQ